MLNKDAFMFLIFLVADFSTANLVSSSVNAVSRGIEHDDDLLGRAGPQGEPDVIARNDDGAIHPTEHDFHLGPLAQAKTAELFAQSLSGIERGYAQPLADLGECQGKGLGLIPDRIHAHCSLAPSIWKRPAFEGAPNFAARRVKEEIGAWLTENHSQQLPI
jgi:hypothetical protein